MPNSGPFKRLYSVIGVVGTLSTIAFLYGTFKWGNVNIANWPQWQQFCLLFPLILVLAVCYICTFTSIDVLKLVILKRHRINKTLRSENARLKQEVLGLTKFKQKCEKAERDKIVSRALATLDEKTKSLNSIAANIKQHPTPVNMDTHELDRDFNLFLYDMSHDLEWLHDTVTDLQAEMGVAVSAEHDKLMSMEVNRKVFSNEQSVYQNLEEKQRHIKVVARFEIQAKYMALLKLRIQNASEKAHY